MHKQAMHSVAHHLGQVQPLLQNQPKRVCIVGQHPQRNGLCDQLDRGRLGEETRIQLFEQKRVCMDRGTRCVGVDGRFGNELP